MAKMNRQQHFARSMGLGLRRPINALLRTRLVSVLAAPHHVDGYLELFDPSWSLRDVRACLVGIHPEGDDATSLWLLPNENWRGFRAGQFTQLSIRLRGVRYTRTFSISSAPEDGVPLRLTIKARKDGRVSSSWTRGARLGEVVGLGPAMGEFVLPDPAPNPLLFVSGGSGITPLVSMARHLASTRYTGRLAWLHYPRHEVILGEDIRQLATCQPRWKIELHMTRATNPDGPVSPRVSQEQLAALAPWWRESETFACGPAPLLKTLSEIWNEAGIEERLHMERFSTSHLQRPERAFEDNTPFRIAFTKSGQEVQGEAAVSLLEQAEAAGLRPNHGCRIGICHSCSCIKRSGVVRNQVTGLMDDEDDRMIQLCVTTPCSDVTLDL